jgi:dihydroorotase
MILLKKATIIDNRNKLHGKQRDILIKNGKIARIAIDIVQDGARVIEHKDLHVSIGFIDSSVSLGEPGFEERQTIANGLKAAAAGGFTSIMLNANNAPNPQDRTGIDFIKNATAGSAVNVLPIGNFTLDQAGEHHAQLYDMHQAGAVSFYDYKRAIKNAKLLKLGLQYTKTFQGIIQSFPLEQSLASNGQVNEDMATAHLGLRTQPSIAEEIQIARDLALATYTQGRLHIPTVTTAAGIKIITAAKKMATVTCSVSVHHLVCSTDNLADFNANYKTQPPLRSNADREQLVQQVLKGNVDMITSDHTPLTIEQKDLEFDYATAGTVGLESTFCVLNELLDTKLTVAMLTNAYEAFLLLRPVIEEGAAANLTFFTTAGKSRFSKEKIVSTAKNSALVGVKTSGNIIGIYNNNKLVLHDF